jgi:glycosyltransferase involved in cell wall biosynthesis
VLVIPLGETSPDQVDAAVRRQFAEARVVVFERQALRRRPLRVLGRLWTRRFDAAVLVAPDLAQPRLRLTSSLLALARAGSHWRIDLQGGRERWGVGEYLAREGGPIARHLFGCGLALTLGEPLLRALAARIQPRDLRELLRAARGQRTWPARWTRIRTGPPAESGRWPPNQRARKATLPQADASTGRRDTRSAAIPPPTGGHANASSHVPLPVHRRAAPASTGLGPRARILYLRSQLWLGLAGGGSVAHTAGVIGGLTAAGAEVQVVASDHLAGVGVATRVVRPEVWFDGWLRELEDLAYNVAFTLSALHAARAFRPDLLYQRHTAFNVSGAILSRLLDLPLVVEFNSSEVWKGRYWGGLRLERAALLVEAINLRAADRVIVVSRVLRDELVARGLPPPSIVVNPNAVDTRIFRADVDGRRIRRQISAESDVVIGFSGTFGAWHGIPTLATALGLVLAARPHARWLLIGDGPLRPLIDAAVTAHPHLAQRVTLVGMRPHVEMPSYLAACDILVSPHGKQADGAEFFGSPTKLFEYMASGRPIVASNVGQIADVLTDQASALLVPPDDPAALAAAVVRLIDDSCLRARLGSAARAAAEAHHTWRQNAERVLECIEAR